ncbi:chaperone NapD [Limisalsivibrio acetivorans]|uniref:chaperone NapD n=1 Tax=Limisalsivibrio acetivorans TaxID=1304888 RepID=UPI0003B66632|nr:chaperone NapD [Limisalsivibrio acetivorans]
MIFAGSIITVNKDMLEEADELLKSYDEIEVYTVSDDYQAVVAIETKGNKELEALTNELNTHDSIIEISHHYVYFGDEVQRMIDKGESPKELEELFRSYRGDPAES